MRKPLKEVALRTALEALKCCSPDCLVRDFFETEPEKGKVPDWFFKARKIFLLAVGKAAIPMARTAGEIIGWQRIEGLIVSRKETDEDVSCIPLRVIRGGHPLPDEDSFLAGRMAYEMIGRLEAGIPVLFLISGGTSALFEHPIEEINLDEARDLTERLLRSGASIHEINKVRTALSRVKGGGLLEVAGDRKSLSLILSDVVGDRMETIGSGPSVPPVSNNAAEASEILDRYHLSEYLTPRVKSFLEGASRSWKKFSGWRKTRSVLIGNNRLLCEKVLALLREEGFNTLFLGSMMSGEASETGHLLADLALEVRTSGNPVKMPAAIVSGGETVVTLRENRGGRGGPNQEVALSFATHAAGERESVLLSMDTDGFDGPTDFAGGLVDGRTAGRVRESGLDPRAELERHNSYGALEASGDFLKTGSTGNNLNDLRILLLREDD